MKGFIALIILAGVVLFVSSQWANVLGKFVNSVIQASDHMTRKEVSEDSIERFKKQVNLLRVKYEKVDEEREESDLKNKDLQEDFDTTLVKRKENLGQLMQVVVEDEAQKLQGFEQSQGFFDNNAPKAAGQSLPPTPPPLGELKSLTQKLVSDSSVDLRQLMEQYDQLDEQRKIMMENMRSNADLSQERSRQSASEFRAITERLAQGSSQNLRNLMETFEQLEMSRHSMNDNRQRNEFQIRDISLRIKDNLNSFKNNLQMASSENLDKFNSLQDQRMALLKQQLENNEQMHRNARQLNSSLNSLESSMIRVAESQSELLKEKVIRMKEVSEQLKQKQSFVMDQLQSNLDEQRSRNEQRMSDMKERIEKLAELNDSNKQKIKEQMEDMKFKQAQSKERMESQMQMIRDKIQDQKYR